MIEDIKALAKTKIEEQLVAMGVENAAEVSETGAMAFFQSILEQIQGGKIFELIGMITGGGNLQESEIWINSKAKLIELFTQLGIADEKAEEGAINIIKNIFSGITEKFQSSDEKDAAFDLSKIGDLISGGKDDIQDAVKNIGNIFK